MKPKLRIFIVLCIAFTSIKAQTPDEKKDLESGRKELNEIRKITIQGLKECRRMELFHLKFQQAHRTKKDIEICKKDF